MKTVSSLWKGLHSNRYDREPLERAFASAFQALCSQERPNHLDLILSRDSLDLKCSDRDRTVACTIIQWLGSNVGQQFVKDVMEIDG